MNISTANNYSIAEWLKQQSTAPQQMKSTYFWYNSPFKPEPSLQLRVDTKRNVWHDYYLGAGGSLVDLICWVYRVSAIDAVKILAGDIEPKNKSLFFESHKERHLFNDSHISAISNVASRALEHYLRKLHLWNRYSSDYFKQATVSVGEMKHHVIAFKNDEGGYILKSECYNGYSIPGAVTTILPGQKLLNVFQSFIDYMSALTYYRLSEPSNTTIVLNNLSLLPKIVDKLEKYDSVNLYLGNDSAGKKAAVQIALAHNDIVNQANRLYPNFKTINDYLIDRTVNPLKYSKNRL